MKILFFVDTHGKLSGKLIDKSKDADILVCAGDFTVFESDMTQVLSEINGLGKPVIMIHGNHETSSAVMQETKKFSNLHFIHKSYFIYEDVIFYGFGGGGFSLRDESFTKESDLFIKEFEKISTSKKYRIVLVTHAPPYGTSLDDIGGHVGNKNIADFIRIHKPMIAVSGHLHENAQKMDKLGETKIINPGPDGMLIEV